MNQRGRWGARICAGGLSLLLTVTGLTGCAPRSETASVIAIPVTPLIQAAPLGDAPAQPIYALVAEDSDWDRLAGRIPEAALKSGRQADAATQVVVVAFGGVKGSSGYQVAVRQAILQADALTITVAMSGPSADAIVEPASTLPFALAALPRDALAAARSYMIVDERGNTLARDRIQAIR